MAEETNSTGITDTATPDGVETEMSDDQLLTAMSDPTQMESLSQTILDQVLAEQDGSISTEMQGDAKEALMESILEGIANGMSPQEAAAAAKLAAKDVLSPQTADSTSTDEASTEDGASEISLDAVMEVMDSPAQLETLVKQILESQGESIDGSGEAAVQAFMDAFPDALANGLSPAEALSAAQDSMSSALAADGLAEELDVGGGEEGDLLSALASGDNIDDAIGGVAGDSDSINVDTLADSIASALEDGANLGDAIADGESAVQAENEANAQVEDASADLGVLESLVSGENIDNLAGSLDEDGASSFIESLDSGQNPEEAMQAAEATAKAASEAESELETSVENGGDILANLASGNLDGNADDSFLNSVSENLADGSSSSEAIATTNSDIANQQQANADLKTATDPLINALSSGENVDNYVDDNTSEILSAVLSDSTKPENAMAEAESIIASNDEASEALAEPISAEDMAILAASSDIEAEAGEVVDEVPVEAAEVIAEALLNPELEPVTAVEEPVVLAQAPTETVVSSTYSGTTTETTTESATSGYTSRESSSDSPNAREARNNQGDDNTDVIPDAAEVIEDIIPDAVEVVEEVEEVEEVETPTLTVSDSSGVEDSEISLNISAGLTDSDGSESISITITGVPEGATLSNGIDNGDGSWTLDAEDLEGLTVTPPTDSDDDFTLDVITTSSNANGEKATTTGTIGVSVDARADTPVFKVSNSSGVEDSSIILDISAAVTDSSESLSITIGGVPDGATLSNGTDNGDGSWTLSSADLDGLTITPAENSDEDFTLTVSATSTEADGGDSAITTGTIDVSVAADADAPILNISDTAGTEDQAIALDISAVVTDDSESLSITIGGVPEGATLSNGTDNGD
ncbi:MAG: hypothetical protein HQL70_07800, partial [Magnetococcales bacterium]|nr:hypothetical protein [Magnetococcales bacterium]